MNYSNMYWPEKALKEALGCKDDDILGAIKKLKEDNDLLKEVHANHISMLNDYAKLGLELGIGSGDAESIKDYIDSLKKERDQLKDRLRTYRIIAHGTYGDSCGYSGDKAPAFHCNVISYSWSFDASAAFRSNSIRVELELTPTANYKGSFDLEDLKKYIQEYGREKKLGIIESVDYQNAKVARAELAYLYKQVLGKEKLDRDLSPHEVMKAILDEVKQLRDSLSAFSQSLRSVYMHIYEGTGYDISDIYAAPDKIAEWIITRYDSTKTLGHMETVCDINDFIDELCDKHNVIQPARSKTTRERIEYIFSALTDYRNMADSNFNKAVEFRKEKQAVENVLTELRAKIREIYRSVVDDEWDEYLAYTSALNDINEEYKRVVHNFEERTADWSKAQQELDRYRLAVGSLLGIPKGTRDDINAIERAFTFSKKMYESLKEFHNNVCEIFDIPSSMTDEQILQILENVQDDADRYDELEGFRSDICGILDIESLTGTPQQNDKYILEQIEELKGDHCDAIIFRNDVAKAIGLTVKDCNSDIINRVVWIKECHDKLARLRSNICTALCLGGETDNEDILKAVEAVMERATELQFNAVDKDEYDKLSDCRDRLYEDYTELRKAIWDAMDRKPETLPNETAKLVGEVTELARGEKLLIEFRDEIAKAIGITYPTTNNFIVRRVEDIYKGWGELHDLIPKLRGEAQDLQNKYDDAESRFKFQSGLRQQWHARYESEHERANGVQKALDREKAKCHIKDAALETAKKQYDKVCSNLETAECALNGMKSKVRELREEKTKVISAIGQDIWDDCVK